MRDGVYSGVDKPNRSHKEFFAMFSGDMNAGECEEARIFESEENCSRATLIQSICH